MKTRKTKKPRQVGKFLTEYDSMAQAASATGIPIAVFRLSKKEGCPAFRHGRVSLPEFLRWWFARSDDDNAKDWGKELNRVRTLRETVKLSVDEGRVVDRDEVVFLVNKGFAALSRIMDRKIKVELPPDLKGRTEAEIMARLGAALGEALDACRVELAKLRKEKLK